MKDDTGSSLQPTLWGEAPEHRSAGTRSRGAARQHRTAAEAGELWTIDEVADYLGVPKQTVYSWRTSGYGPTGSASASTCAGGPRRWCSAKCRRSASEERRAAAAGAIATHYVQVDVSLDDHVQAVLASPAARRRVLRDLGERYDAGKLGDARWNPVAEELQRTRPQLVPPFGGACGDGHRHDHGAIDS